MEFIHCESLLRKTSIAQFRVMKASAKVKSQIILHGGDLLCGMFFCDTLKTNYVFFSTDKGIIRKSVTTSHIGKFFLRPFISPVKPRGGIIQANLNNIDGFIHERTNERESLYSEELELEVVDFLICNGSYEEDLNFLQKYLIRNKTRIIKSSDYHQMMKRNFKSIITSIDPAIIDDITRYKRGKRQQVISVMHNMINATKDNSLQLIIFGAGGMGRMLIESQIFKGSVKFVVDNNPKKWGQGCAGLTIYSPSELLKLDNKLVLVASMYFTEIEEQLIAMGLNENKDFIDAEPLYQLLIE